MSGTIGYDHTVQLDSGLILPTSALNGTPVVGKVWTAGSGAGDGSWQALPSAFSLTPVSKSATYTAVAQDFVVATSGTFTVTSPAHTNARVFGVFNTASGRVTVSAAAGFILASSGWAAGTAASIILDQGDGVILISNGTNWHVIGGLRASLSSAAPRVTALPASPIDGDECVYVADATNGVEWRFKYKSVETKWRFIGGPPLTSSIATSEARNNATFGDLTTAGPSVTVPLAGDYMIQFNVQGNPVSPETFTIATIKLGAATAVDADSAVGLGPAGAIHTPGRTYRRNGLAAAAALKMQYRNAATNNTNYSSRDMSVWPVRCS